MPEDRWQDAFEELQSDGSGDCPRDEQLTAVVVGEIDGGRKTAIVDHALECKRCSRALKDRMALHEAAGGAVPVTGRSARTWGVLGTVAATLALISIVSFGLLDNEPPTSDQRGAAVESGAVIPAHRATLARVPDHLSWLPDPEAASFTVVLYDAESTPIWESAPVTTPSISVPQETRERIVVRVVYYWRVISVVGGERRQSPLYRFIVEP